MKKSSTAPLGALGGNEDATTIWLCLLAVFITLWV